MLTGAGFRGIPIPQSVVYYLLDITRDNYNKEKKITIEGQHYREH
jgi:hypothetical protein